MSSTVVPSARRIGLLPILVPAAGVGVVLAGLALGESLTREGAQETGELGLDVSISHVHEAALTAGARALDLVASPVLGPLLVAVACLLLWVRRARASAIALCLMTASGWLVASSAKLLLHRQRPPMANVHALVHETAADSCPSGHTAFAASLVVGIALALAVSGRSTRGAWMWGVPFVAIVAASRLYLGAHYLGDVMTSVVLVSGLALVLWAPIARFARRQGAQG